MCEGVDVSPQRSPDGGTEPVGSRRRLRVSISRGRSRKPTTSLPEPACYPLAPGPFAPTVREHPLGRSPAAFARHRIEGRSHRIAIRPRCEVQVAAVAGAVPKQPKTGMHVPNRVSGDGQMDLVTFAAFPRGVSACRCSKFARGNRFDRFPAFSRLKEDGRRTGAGPFSSLLSAGASHVVR
jgi:hypothetical protein